MRAWLLAVTIVGCGDSHVHMDASSDVAGPNDAAIDAPLCSTLVCDDQDPCTNDVCDPTAGCRHVALDRCGTPACQLPPACAGSDTDGDGLSDAVETQGYVDLDCNGVLDPALDLDLPGASPTKADVYVELDYMEKPGAGNTCSAPGDCTVPGEQCVANVCTHTHAPDAAALDAVVTAFANNGINLHIDPVHDALPEHAVVSFYNLDASCVGPDAESFWAIKAAHFDPRRRWVYRYGVFGHYNTCAVTSTSSCAACSADPTTGLAPQFGTTGIAELPGNDFIVSQGRMYFDLGLARTLENQGGTLMHELGHTLGLKHGGGESQPTFKPNYLSVMGSFQFIGVPYTAMPGSTAPIIGHRIDYSGSTLPTLDENALDETAGFGGTTADLTAFTNGMFQGVVAATSGPVDWDGNGTIDTSPVAVDINGDGVNGTLIGWRDWPTQPCTTDADCPLVPPTIVDRVPCVNHTCATMTFAFQCTTAGTANGPSQLLPWLAPHSVCSAP